MRKSTILLFVMALMLMALPASAQNTSQWMAYLYDNINNNLIRISSEGEPETFSLGIPTGSWMYGMSISPDGSQIAYCYDHREDPQAQGSMRLIVRDIDQETTLLAQDLGPLVGCSVSAFNGDIFALSIVHLHEFNVPVTGKLWELRLIEALTGETVASIDNETEGIPTVEMFGNNPVPFLMRVRELSRERVTMMAIPYIGSEGPAVLPALEWNVTDNSLSLLPEAHGYYNSDFLPETGEIVYSGHDESIPAAMPAGPMPQTNVVKVWNGESDVVIYQNSEMVITGTSFVNNGQGVLISLSPGFDETQPEVMPTGTSFVLVNRDGSVVEFAENFNGAVFVDGIENGALMVYTPNAAQPEHSAPQVFILTSENVIALDSFVPIDFSQGWSPPSLVWVSPSAVSSDLSPFTGQ